MASADDNDPELLAALKASAEHLVGEDQLPEKLKKDFNFVEVYGGGDCFFDTIAKGIHLLDDTSDEINKDTLRTALCNYYTSNLGTNQHQGPDDFYKKYFGIKFANHFLE